MSKVTDRLDNKQIVELAKKQYEQQKQNSKFPANIINLPSQGKVYPETSALNVGKIEMRHMTAYDEDILSNNSYIKEGIVFDKLLEALIVTPGVHINELVAGDKEWLVISARILGYGNEYDTAVVDPKTNETVAATIDLSKLKSKPFTAIADENGCFEYIIDSTNDILKYKFLSANNALKIKQETLSSTFLKMSIYSVNGDSKKTTIDDYLKYDFKALDSRKFRKHVIQVAPGLEYKTTATGVKGDTYDAMFQFNADLFWF